jgi:peptidoglycan/xylan/chitin deacetylase (PgdA/CDA1 family)
VYRSVRTLRLREAAKPVLEEFLARTGAIRLSRARAARRPLVLAYHNVVPDGAAPGGDASLHLPREAFARQLDALVRDYDVVPLDRILEDTGARRARPRVAITLDDAYRGAMTVGVEELEQRGLPATVFVAPALVGGPGFWWDAFAIPEADRTARTFRARALEEWGGKDPEVRRRASALGVPEREVPPHAAPATADELRAAARHRGLRFASHSFTHPNLCRLRGPELLQELTRPLAWLRERFADVVPWLAYPYGLSSPAVEQAARAAGYQAAVRIDGGRLPARAANRYAIPRINLPAGISLNGFALRIAGLLDR